MIDANIEVSIVIICMNNLKNLYPCLESIRRYTTVSYETLVVAYLFSKENLEKVRQDFPWVTFIESNEIRGFSENNNLALRQAKGKYCFVVNDDTEMKMPVIDNLIRDIEKLPEKIAILSPVTLNKDGSVQRNGKPFKGVLSFLMDELKIEKLYDSFSKYTNGSGLYKSYNISGACFLIRKEIFEKFGWFDERYFFCPEDIALSTNLNKNGYECWVDANIKITHFGGGTWSKIQSATMPTSAKGLLIFAKDRGIMPYIFTLLISYFFHALYGLIWFLKCKIKYSEKSKVMYTAHFNTLKILLSPLSPKDIFRMFYLKIYR